MIPVWARPGFVTAAILAYLAIHFAVRMAMWPTLGSDDAEQALFAQDFSWIYATRGPPLFTWLLLSLGGVMPVNIVSISILRYALLGLTFGFSYLAARRLIADPRLSALVVYSFAAIHTVAEASHRQLTHSTMLAALLAVAFYIFVRLCAEPRLRWYLALGAISGLGALGKWNFVMFFAALALACLLHPRYRHLVLTWKSLPAAALAVAIVAPTVVAVSYSSQPAGEVMRSALAAEAGPSLARIGKGTWDLLDAIVVYPEPLLPLAAFFFGLALWRALKPAMGDGNVDQLRPSPTFVGLTIVVCLALYWALVIFFGATQFKPRYLHAPLLFLPLWLFMVIERGRPAQRTLNLFAAVLLVLAVKVPVQRILSSSGVIDCGTCANMIPFRPFADQLRAAGFEGQGTIVAAEVVTAGNMRVEFPRARIVEPRYPAAAWPPVRGVGQCLMVWRPGETGENLPDAQESYLIQELHGEPDAPHQHGLLTALMLGSDSRTSQLGFRLFDASTGDCR